MPAPSSLFSSAALALPAGYPRVRVVTSFDELVATPFADGVNALCWPRQLDGDFAEVVRQLGQRTVLAAPARRRFRRSGASTRRRRGHGVD
jgi:hypothetical protein